MPAFLIQHAFDYMVNRCRRCYSAAGHVMNGKLALNLVVICLDNTIQISYKSLLCFAKIWNIGYSKIGKIGLAKF